MISTQDEAIASTQHEALMQQVEHAALALAGRSREIEAQRWLPQDIADTLATAGLYRLLTPQASRVRKYSVSTYDGYARRAVE